MSHPDRGRAESFGSDAQRYDRARPGYPQAPVADLLAAYRAHAPELISDNVALGTLPPLAGLDLDAVAGAGNFGEAACRRYDWDRKYAPGQLTDELSTHSIHRSLAPAALAGLLAAIEAGLSEIGSFSARYQTSAFTVRRR